MNSLVGYGVSSDSEDEEETQREAAKNDESKQKKSCNFLLESGTASSESGSESEPDEELEEEHAPVSDLLSPEDTVPPQVSSSSNKLPSPALGGFCVPVSSSVFANPFKERAEQKLNVLQKHVPLTYHARPSHIGGKRMCVAYRKNGRCRFGIRCKFAHDSDLQQNVAEPTDSDSNNTATHTPACRELAVESKRGDEEENQSRRKKNRVGVTDSLIPPKRALKQYTMQREKASFDETDTQRPHLLN